MKTIYFIRHAKSSWDDISLDDHNRPLDKRGKRDAPLMANRLLELGVVPDGILSSTASRARETSEAFRRILNVSAANCQYDKSLYHAWPAAIETRMQELPAHWETVLLFGHNPGYTDLANALQHDSFIGNVPTCGIIVARSDVDSWQDFRIASARRTAHYYPKQHQ